MSPVIENFELNLGLYIFSISQGLLPELVISNIVIEATIAKCLNRLSANFPLLKDLSLTFKIEIDEADLNIQFQYNP